MNTTYFTSESVASGHPDKICDQISDAILDAALYADPLARVAVETLVTFDRVIIAGEVTCSKALNYTRIARKVIKSLGYTGKKYNFSDKSPILVYVHTQTRDIAREVEDGGAGDQGMMFGYATNETPELMPLPIVLAHKIVERLDRERMKGSIPYLQPDGKSQVNVKYENDRPAGIEQVAVSVPYNPKIRFDTVRNEVYRKVIYPVIRKYKLAIPPVSDVILNGKTGKWAIGGPASDTGVTGRKVIVDTYGSFARHGGGAFSGKDPTKVDRSGAYAARFIAKNIVAHKLADRVEVRLAYVIGFRDPVAKAIETFGTEHVAVGKIETFAWSLMDLSVSGIIKKFRLQRPIYQDTARYGHFGNSKYPWEKIVK